MRAWSVIGCGLLTASLWCAQAADPPLTFEVASVKPHVAITGEPRGATMTGGPGTDGPGQIAILNRTLRGLILDAYAVRGFQLENEHWLREKKFDVIAKIPRDTTPEQCRVMLQNLLAERFHLEIRRETRDLPAYALVTVKGGVKMKPSRPTRPGFGEFLTYDETEPAPDPTPQTPPPITKTYVNGKAKVSGQRQPIAKIVGWLSAMMDRPVVDLTGLKDNYDFSLLWSSDAAPPGVLRTDLFPALPKQLGLRLESRKMPIEMLVVVSSLKAPTEN